MKQLLSLFLFLLPCLAWAQYPGNAGQKITLGEQTTADGLVYRGLAADTTRKPSVDTMAYILLDTNTNIIWQYKKAVNNAWTRINLRQSDTTSFNYVNTYGAQTVNGTKTFNNRLISTNAMHFVDTALSIVSFAKKTVQPSGMVGGGTGVLSTKTDYTTGTSPFSLTVDPTGRFVYVANQTTNNVSMFVINQTNGTLSTKTDFTTGTDPRSVSVDPTGRFVYVANRISNTVSMFVINQSDGTLSAKTDYNTGTEPFSVNVDPTGRFVYVANRISNTVSMFVINQTNGTLSTKTDFTTGTDPRSVSVDPTGRFVYVANRISNTVSMFVINQSNGTLSAKTDYNTNTDPRYLTVDPTGRFVYVVNINPSTVSMYVINQTDGTLSTKTDFTTGASPISVNVDPTGRFVYVANNGSNTVSMFVINQTNGTLNTKTDFTTGTQPHSVNVDPTGRFVYVANNVSNNVSQYFMQSFSAGGAYIAGRLSVGVDSAQTNYRVNIGTTFKQDSLFVGGRVTAVGYTTRSDIDAKENITPINYGINEVMQFEPVAYNYLNEENKSLGFIAQDIGLIIPEAISWETPFSVYYQYLIPILTKAIQEQQGFIKSLQQRLLILENK
jgi:6-phosphogluconolactonase (cycloisomerase 2 family)